jgi:hypothetical protein
MERGYSPRNSSTSAETKTSSPINPNHVAPPHDRVDAVHPTPPPLPMNTPAIRYCGIPANQRQTVTLALGVVDLETHP